MSVSSAMRTGDRRAGTDAREAAEQARAFDAEIAGGSEPSDWRTWSRSFSEVAGLRHGGMAGVTDTAFFRRVHAFVNRQHAPGEAKASVDFHESILGWNYAAAAVAADPLIRAAMRGDAWIDPDLLRDGAVMAMLETGDRAGARDAFRALAPLSGRAPNDLRTELLLSYVLDPAQRISPPR
jgi:integrase